MPFGKKPVSSTTGVGVEVGVEVGVFLGVIAMSNNDRMCHSGNKFIGFTSFYFNCNSSPILQDAALSTKENKRALYIEETGLFCSLSRVREKR